MTKRRKKGQLRDPLGQLQSEWTEEEEDDGISTIIPDGGKVRVSLTMMDSLQKAVAKDAPTNKLLVDDGTDNTLNLQKPGFRYSTDTTERTAADAALTEAYEARELADRQAWRSSDDHPLNYNARGLSRGQHDGDSCSIDGQRGRLKMVNGKLECVADSRDAQTVSDAYAEYDREAENAWRK